MDLGKMSKEDLLKLIGGTESLNIEWKPSLSQINEIIETISAFANTEGGKIIIGISKSGKLLGVEIGKDTIERLTNKIFQNTDPKVHPRITTKKINSKCIIIIEVKESSDHLVLAFGRPYKRVGKSTVRMSKDEYERLILEKHKDKLHFGNQVCKKATLKDINWDFIKEKFIPLYEKVSEKRIIGSPKSLLESLNCIKDNKLSNAGILLFGKNPQRFFINAYIALARYKGKEIGAGRLDYKEFEGSLIKQIDDCDRYIKEHIAVMSRLLPHKVHPLKPKMPKISADEYSVLVTLFSTKEKFEKGKLGLNERQKKAIEYTRKKGKIINSEYQKINGVTKKTATRDLQDLVRREIMFKQGRTGKGVFYILNPVYKGT